MRYFSTIAFLAASLLGGVIAHPGDNIENEIRSIKEWQAHPDYRSLKTCESSIKARDQKHIESRISKYHGLREKRGLSKLEGRSFRDVLLTSHHSNKTVDANSTPEEIFGSNASCILQPKVTEGPYYVTGELVRQDITDDAPGVPLTFELLLINTQTCEPLENVYLEAWYCNSTGVYGGVSARGNGNANDGSNLYNTALRGIQLSDSDGIVQFDAIAPGHYTGRAVHIHIMAHIGATEIANGTISGGTIAQIGQLFLDQTLNNAVNEVSPYSTNTQTFMLNREDGIMAQEAATSDPILEYVYLGDDISDGIFAWATVGINPNAKYTASAAAHYPGPA